MKNQPEPLAPTTWFTVNQAAQYMGCTIFFVRRLCHNGLIPYAVLGQRFVLRREDMDMFVESKKKPALYAL